MSVDQEETSSIYIYPTTSDAERISIIDIHRGIISLSLSPSFAESHYLSLSLSEVTDLCWEPTSLYLISAANDRHIRVWHNTLGQKELIRELQEKLPKASSEPLKVAQSILTWRYAKRKSLCSCFSLQRRMQQQISDAE